MKAETWITLGLVGLIIYGIIIIVREGRKLMDQGLGENPLGLAGENEWNMGPLAWGYYLTSGGTTARYEAAGGDVPWWLDPWDWNPLAGRWGMFG